jgi:non-homologous end joining protein Ku
VDRVDQVRPGLDPEVEEAAGPSAVPDLMAALKASVEQLQKEEKKRRPRRKRSTG